MTAWPLASMQMSILALHMQQLALKQMLFITPPHLVQRRCGVQEVPVSAMLALTQIIPRLQNHLRPTVSCASAAYAAVCVIGLITNHSQPFRTLFNTLSTLSTYTTKWLAELSLMCVCRLVSTAYELYWHRLPFLITDLTSQSTGYTATQPCMDTLLYQIEHINQTVIALPSVMSVRPPLKSDSCLLSLMTCLEAMCKT